METSDPVNEGWFFVALLGLIALTYGWIYRDFAQDDAFITYRFARNIARGHGFVYNLGEPVLGTTSPLYALWLAVLGKASGHDIPLISHWISIFSLWLGAVVLYYLARPEGVPQAGAVALIFVTNPMLGWSIGMETCLVNLFVLLVIISYVRHKLTLTGALMGILLLLRYETILLAFILAGHYVLKERRLPVWLAAGLPLSVAWSLFAWFTFGGLIPQSASAKLAARRLPFLVGALVYWRLYVSHNPLYAPVVPLVALGGYRAIRTWYRRLGFSLILVWSIVYFVAASLVAGAFPWYYGPLVPAFAILAVWGTDMLVSLAAPFLNRWTMCDQPKRAAHSVLMVVVVAIMALQVDLWAVPGTAHRGRRVDPRYTTYKEVSKWLNENAEKRDTLATPEIGVLGYYTDMRIIDLHGLVTPRLAPRHDEDVSRTLERAIALYSPDYVMASNDRLVEELERSSLYEQVRTFGGGSYALYEESGN